MDIRPEVTASLSGPLFSFTGTDASALPSLVPLRSLSPRRDAGGVHLVLKREGKLSLASSPFSDSIGEKVVFFLFERALISSPRLLCLF